MSSTAVPIAPAWLTIGEVGRYVGCGRTSVYKAISAGRLEARSAFGRTLVSRASIDTYLAAAPIIGAFVPLAHEQVSA